MTPDQINHQVELWGFPALVVILLIAVWWYGFRLPSLMKSYREPTMCFFPFWQWQDYPNVTCLNVASMRCRHCTGAFCMAHFDEASLHCKPCLKEIAAKQQAERREVHPSHPSCIPPREKE